MPSSRGTITARDSAGVQVVEHTARAIDDAPELVMGPRHTLSVGKADGSDEDQLFRVTGVQVTRNGELVVVNSGTSEVRWYNADGVLLHTAGRPGSGPGEFEAADMLVRWPGDTIAVWDVALRRIALFDNHSHVADLVVDATVAIPEPARWVPTAHLVLAERWVPWPESGAAEGYLRVFRVDRAGQLIDTVGVYPWISVTRVDVPGMEPMMDEGIFGAQSVFAAASDGYWVGENHDAVVRRFDAATGRLRQVIRWDAGDRTPTAADVSAYRSRALAAATTDADRRRRRQIDAARRVADRFPVYVSLLVDRVEHLWVQLHVRPDMPSTIQPWLVFDTEGRLRGTLDTPPSFRILDIGEGHVAGVHTDEMGVEYVQVFPLTR